MEAENYGESARQLGEILDGALSRKAKQMRIEHICAEAVREYVNVELGEDDRKKPVGRSLYAYLLEEMAKAASDYALAADVDPEDFKAFELHKALIVVDELRSALICDARLDKRLNFWDDESPLDKIKTKKVPFIEHSAIENVVGNYLALPYRSLVMDRYLVRILIAMELYAFGDEMLNEKTFGLLPATSPLKQRHALIRYLRNRILDAALSGGIAALALWASSKGWISDTSAMWTAGICVFLFLLDTAITTVVLPFTWSKQSKARKRVLNLLSKMVTIYNEVRSNGPISAKHIHDRATKASQEGVVWPAPLFALLDDIICRTGRF
jgi:hypothetical protein